ncbi:MAG: ATP-binding cassette domain-containing protein [Bacteroidota bacterium]|nr:ATP-binding cassette domain-containing protein [Bacteroidota bacterium]MDP4192246.1 ATP-binding cassette domain-containing protein [Bacteroidota bacterium]
MLLVDNIYKKYKETIAVKDVSFDVSPGEIFGILGPNGAGKTTTIRMILNIIKPTQGKITFNGKPIGEDFLNKTGYLPEERGLYKKSRVISILRYFGELKGMTKKAALNEGAHWLERLEISQYGSRPLEELSKGNQQKVQFISSILHNPRLLVLDEPFSGFDPLNQQFIKAIIAEFIEDGKIVIISTHLMEIAETLCNKILVINKGQEILKGNLREIKKRYSSNYYNIGFEGNAGGVLSEFPMVKVLSIDNTKAKIELAENFKPSDLIRLISGSLNINYFSSADPSLYDIFLETIQKAS